MPIDIRNRKAEHIKIILEKGDIVDIQNNGFQDVILIHQPLPEIDFNKIDTSTTFLGRKMSTPLMIDAMTGGTAEAKEINRTLAEVANEKNIVFAVGSQRAMIQYPELIDTYYIRDIAPNVLFFGNIGITQLKQLGPEKVIEALEKIGADGIGVHINPAQEIFQEGGDTNFEGCYEALRRLCKESKYPVIGKEVGNGMSREGALMLKDAGVKAIDVGGFGGTNWLVVDAYRAGKDFSSFRDWGIPTPLSILESKVGLPIIATGGMRSGPDVAKAIALGAEFGGMVSPFIKAIKTEGKKGVIDLIEKLQHELKIAMFLSKCRNVSELKKTKYVLTGKVKEWADQRGLR